MLNVKLSLNDMLWLSLNDESIRVIAKSINDPQSSYPIDLV